jgi:hypothetical protein
MGRQIVVTLPDGHKVSATTDGCVASVRRQLYGDLGEWLRNEFAIQGIAKEAHDRVLSDRRYLDALDAWRACMRARGYRFADPGAARDAVGAQQQAQGRSLGHDQLRIRETAVAVAEAECARGSRLVSVATDLDRSYHAQVTAQQEGVVIAYREQQARGLQRARALLGAP